VKQENACEEGINITIVEENSEFTFTCMEDDTVQLESDTYIVKSGFEEHTLEESLQAGHITVEDLAHVIEIKIIVPNLSNEE
jgi:hypothetical protein